MYSQFSNEIAYVLVLLINSCDKCLTLIFSELIEKVELPLGGVCFAQ